MICKRLNCVSKNGKNPRKPQVSNRLIVHLIIINFDQQDNNITNWIEHDLFLEKKKQLVQLPIEHYWQVTKHTPRVNKVPLKFK